VQIVEQNADYVLALKDNHSAVHDNVVKFFEQLDQKEPQPVVQDDTISSHERVDGDHGWVEIRRYRQVSDLHWLEERSQWQGLQSVGMDVSCISWAP
jgi:hypothetical protein